MDSIDEVDYMINIIGRMKGFTQKCFSNLINESIKSGKGYVRRLNILTDNGPTSDPIQDYDIENVETIELEPDTDTDTFGFLTIRDKIWFNDDERCRLRICGFSDKHIEELKSAGLIDISITEVLEDGFIVAKLNISEKYNHCPIIS